MKKLFIAVLCMVFLSLVLPLYAQTTADSNEKNVYSKTFVIVKLFTHRFGYLVVYFTPKMVATELYVPIELFTGSNGKARLSYGRGPEYPYLSVTWMDGQIDHITINAAADFHHMSWGVLRGGDEIKSKFQTDLAIIF